MSPKNERGADVTEHMISIAGARDVLILSFVEAQITSRGHLRLQLAVWEVPPTAVGPPNVAALLSLTNVAWPPSSERLSGRDINVTEQMFSIAVPRNGRIRFIVQVQIISRGYLRLQLVNLHSV